MMPKYVSLSDSCTSDLIVEVFPVCTRVFPVFPDDLSGDILADPDLDLHPLSSHIQARGTHLPPMYSTLLLHILLNILPGTVISYA